MQKKISGLFVAISAVMLCLACVGCTTGSVKDVSVLGRGPASQDPAKVPEQPTEARVALVIGNATYQNGPLKNPTNDAQDMALALQRFGFDVTLRTNLDRDGMNDAILAFGHKSQNAKAVVFFYAGHGIQSKSRNYMIPITAEFNDETTLIAESVSVNSLLDILDQSNSQVRIVILDACRNNPLDQGSVRGVRGLARIKPAKGTMIVHATEPGKTATDGTGKNGLLTQGLLVALQSSNLSLGSVLATASEEMERVSAGTQVLYADGAEILKNRFYFNATQQK